MSSYYTKIKVKATGEILDVMALDDYFGKREYGYLPNDYIKDDGSEKRAYRESEIEEINLENK